MTTNIPSKIALKLATEAKSCGIAVGTQQMLDLAYDAVEGPSFYFSPAAFEALELEIEAALPFAKVDRHLVPDPMEDRHVYPFTA